MDPQSPPPAVTTSFVMGVYNGRERLLRTLESISGQTDRDFELIVVDDGSTDGTDRVLESYALRDGRLRVLRQENRGLTNALIRGCDAARGMYIARHDSGDVSLPQRLARQRAALDSNRELVFVSSWTRMVGPEMEPLFLAQGAGLATSPMNILDMTRATCVTDGPSHHGSVMFRREAYVRVGGYRPEFYYGQDWDLWYRLAAVGPFQMVPEALYTAILEPSSISARAKREQEAIATLTQSAARARNRGESDEEFVRGAVRIRKVPRRRCDEARGLYFIGESLRRNGDVRSRKYLRQAVARCPFLIRAWIRLLQTHVS